MLANFAGVHLWTNKKASLSLPVANAHKGACATEAGANDSYSSAKHAILQSIGKARVVACLRMNSGNLALDAARAALDGGITVLEVTMTTPHATEVINALVQEYPSAIIGAGTVLTMKQAEDAKTAGVKFFTSPVMTETIIQAYEYEPALYVPGAMTPTEVEAAYSHGALLVKLYPTSLLGGAAFVNALKRCLVHIPILVSGGIAIETVKAYIAAGATAVVLSDAIFNPAAVAERDLKKIKQAACTAVIQAERA